MLERAEIHLQLQEITLSFMLGRMEVSKAAGQTLLDMKGNNEWQTMVTYEVRLKP